MAPVEAEQPRSTNVEVGYAFDPADKRQLVAFADNVFVGRVLEPRGAVAARTSRPATALPQSQFTVVVTKNIKGRLRGPVTVNQYGGLVRVPSTRTGKRSGERHLELWEGDPLLAPGEVVLLATRHDHDHGWHTVVAQPFADRRIGGTGEEQRLVREFRRAHEAERAR